MNYNFKSIPIIPGAKELIDIVLSKTQRKTPTQIHPQMKITRIRKFYTRKVKFLQSTIEEKLQGIIDNFPKLVDIHPFYSDLINVLYDRDHYKLALGHLNKAKALCENVAKDYVRLLKYSDSLYRAKTLKKAGMGRMCTIIKKLGNSLTYLEEVRKHLGRLPSIDPHTRTLIITGFPNVGKSSFMNLITRAKVEVQPYAFTTKSLFVGHTDYQLLTWQVIDTPGLLDRPIQQRNIIEMQAVTALAHLNACILFFIDISETCGNNLDKQIDLFLSIQPLFVNKPLGIVLSKTDLKRWEQVSQEFRIKIEKLAQDFQAFLVPVSNADASGVIQCRNIACEKLKSYRQQFKTKKGISYAFTGPYVSVPTLSGPARPPLIPESVWVQKQSQVKLRTGPTVKELQEAQGGAGVFSIPVQQHFVELKEEDWRWDIMPQIMDGKNILDFIDPEILTKLEELEKLEEVESEAHQPLDYDELRETYDIKRNIHLRRKAIQRDHMVNKRKLKRNRMDPEKVADGLEKLDIDPLPVIQNASVKKHKRNREEIETNVEDLMDLDDSGENVRKKARAKSREMVRQRRKGSVKPNIPVKELKKRDKHDTEKIVSWKPKHLFSGKRGIGKADRR